MTIELPYPPTVNTIWRHSRGRHYLTERGKNYYNTVAYLTTKFRHRFTEAQRLVVSVEVSPPDRRARDIDNLLKAILDSLVKAHVIPDDSQVDQISICRTKPVKGGKIKVSVHSINSGDAENASG